MIPVIILGSTGSIGTQALEVIAEHPGRFEVVGIAAGSNAALLAEQVIATGAPSVAIANESASPELARALEGRGVEILAGPGGVIELARRAPTGVVLNGITGSIGLGPTLAALESGATLALANKESIVAGGALVARSMVRPGQIVPVDSEHSAIAQALRGGRHERGLTTPTVTGTSEVARIILTASGGPFRGKTRAELTEVTPASALAHPTWAMGPVVTINSSTLMNKGLELIEASLLFDVPPEQITPVIHPQSVIHSMVEFLDGSTIAQASPPSMKLPIALGLSWPERIESVIAPCSWQEATSWTFEPVDHETFPALNLAKNALDAGPLHPAVLNAANEEAVAAFLEERLAYLDITRVVEESLAAFDAPSELSIDTVAATEEWARRHARSLI